MSYSGLEAVMEDAFRDVAKHIIMQILATIIF